jgi:hypothetical protein
MTVNTAFVAGDILTAAQQNNFGRGLMATPATSISPATTTFTSETQMLAYTFTQVIGRNYLLQYFEPSLTGTAAGTITARITTGVAGTPYNSSTSALAILVSNTAMVTVVYTAGASNSLTIYATLAASSGTGTATRSATRFPQLYAVDIGTGY